ncbi:hypothetical protein HU200_018209 [Digitaria exilis]|uniref:O-methyltransferase n=1 Tax=Digitaria exilis TaxID=1010633 RepID=A0A835KJG4_9POAL|nr:hypothetical protein HU200_018209 [Digitaria exilis]
MALLTDEYSSQELLQAQLQLWHQSLGFFKSVALAIAIDLHIPDGVHRLGGAATLPEILAEAGISPCRLRDLRRVMRVLTVSGGIFTVQRQPSHSEDVVYKLTAASHLLVRDNKSSRTMSLLPNVHLMLTACRHGFCMIGAMMTVSKYSKTIPSRDAGGKIIIIDMVMGSESPDIKHVETQVLYDLMIMNFNGVERDEQEWNKIFVEAGFKQYKIMPVLGVRSIIELYP